MPTRAPDPGSPIVEVRRSRKRRRTVSAYREDDRVVVMIPARLSAKEEREWVATMLERLERSEKRRRPSDAGLKRRAAELSSRYLGGLARPETVRWVDNQNSRWGSCTPSDRSIRLSTRLQGMPAWVIDYVLVHELAHLIEAGHTPAFWAWVDRYPKAERAKGFLEGVACATQLGLQAEPPDCSEEGAAAMLATDGSDVEAEES
jgi:predicted metal-dependent hydrolase